MSKTSSDYVGVEDACAIVGPWIDDVECCFECLMRLGLQPYFWHPYPDLPQFEPGSGFWARVQFAGNKRVLERENDCVAVRAYDDQQGTTYRAEHGCRVPLSKVRFRLIDLDDPSETAGPPIDVVRLPPVIESRAIGERRYRDCVLSGLRMPTNPHQRLPDGIGKLADAEGVARPSYTESVRRYMAAVIFKPDP